MWLAVLFDALFGPDIVTTSGAGTNSSTVPSAVAVALFAFLATWALARYAFRRDSQR
jgi:multisubunit Na+/H+ antiporter MnhF subunit